MVQYTSWNGIRTIALQKEVQRRLGLKQRPRSFYTTYVNRATKTGILIKKNTPKANYIYDSTGRLIRKIPKKIEPKYHHYSGYDPESQKIYQRSIRPYMDELAKNPQLKGKIIRHTD